MEDYKRFKGDYMLVGLQLLKFIRRTINLLSHWQLPYNFLRWAVDFGRLVASLFEEDLCEVGQMLVKVEISPLLAYYLPVDLCVVGQMLVKVDFSPLLVYHLSVDTCEVGQRLVKVDFSLLLAYISQ